MSDPWRSVTNTDASVHKTHGKIVQKSHQTFSTHQK